MAVKLVTYCDRCDEQIVNTIRLQHKIAHENSNKVVWRAICEPCWIQFNEFWGERCNRRFLDAKK